MLSTMEVQASHFRGGTLSWSQAGGNSITFTSNTQWRRSFWGAPTVGQTLNLGSMNFGDGQTITLTATVTGVDAVNDILFMSWVYTKTYATAGNYEVSAYNSCCRTSDLEDGNNDQGYSLKATVNVGGTFNNPPVASLPQVVNLPIGVSNATFSIPAVDPEGDAISYRLATGAESGLVTIQPAGSSLSSDGVFTMDTSARTEGQTFSVVFMVEDAESKVPVDIKLVMVGASSPPVFVAPTPAEATVFSVTPPGNTVSFTVAATDPDAGQSTTLNSIALPVGATMTPVLPVTSAVDGTATSVFSWTPSAAQAGQVVLINFVAQDDTGIQATRSISINVLCALEATISNATDPSAPGADDGSISVNIQNESGPGNLLYSWQGPDGFTSSSKDISDLAPGTYNLIVNDTDTGCLATVSHTLATPSQGPTIVCPSDILVDNDPGICGATGVNLGIPMVTAGPPALGNAIDFDGLDHGLTIPDFTSDLLATGTATISAWIYPRLANDDFPDIDVIQNTFKLNTWQHLAITFDGATVKVYHNGLLIASTPASATDILGLISTDNLGQTIADHIPVSLGGKLDEVRVWSIARTQEEIQADMNKEISAQSGLIALYHFNQGIAGGDNTGLTTVIDDSGNGYDMTLHNFNLNGPTSNWVEGKTFYGVTLTNDAPTDYAPMVYDLGDISITWTGTNKAVYPLGETIVTWTAEDCFGNSVSCTQSVFVDLNEITGVVWTGAINTDWTNTGNWLGGFDPGLSLSATIATIPTGAPNYPVLTTGQDLTINECSQVIIDNGASVDFNPNVVLINNGVVDNSGELTMQSDPSGSAYIGPSSGTFIGDATIERFIPPNRAFRLLSSPVTTTDFISNNWQQNTHITGSTVGANGFDATVTGNPSMFTFDNLGQAWNPIPNTDATNLVNGIPHRLMVRGDRTVDIGTNDPPPTPTTLVAKGSLDAENSAPGPLALNPNAGLFNFVGNPFQAQMDMESTLGNALTNTNLNPAFYWVYDPNLGIRGAYSTVVLATNTSTAGSAADKYLQAGQACFVQTIANGASSITFTQDNKHVSTPETNVFKSGSGKSKSSNNSQLSLNLYESMDFANNDSATDGILVFFDDNGNNGVDLRDAPKFTNLDETFGTYTDGTFLAVETRSTPSELDEIQLQIDQYRSTSYVIVANATGLKGSTPYLLDTSTNEFTEVPQSGEVAYAFNVNPNDTESVSENRFKIVFAATSLSTEDQELSKLLLYPNPASEGFVNLSIPQGMDDLEMTVYNTLGARILHIQDFNSKKVTIATSFAKQQGVYFVKLASKGNTITKKLIIE
ncbi:T9SS type A sorting domain-containing protein [Hyunsoonleella sp. SJ7]|uniref:T9SS type A sorting domain-containing protein n=2 Tax=Hyunsoonleella aquatilis TaxID=2762758 RepID=A0A923H8P5_9FLAO|nr:LamG-like jellyroll fold domain-containing protein [Hyunsoonleella aquatilis]MBC3758358.1 T9SS type A sorting domain-containing protein [Hyunsoonleella aquatilis]